ncbi:hypothetical protein FNF31_07722 [Cafeteria roenbergensis]|nr:hypothetical protein FNF31_07722 [Cafeteria roenbergensis]
MGGNPDPYVAVEALARDGDTWTAIGKARTEHVSGSLAPEWDAVLAIGQQPVAVGAGSPLRLRVSVFDYDFISADDLLGSGQVDIEDAACGEGWMRVGGEEGLLLKAAGAASEAAGAGGRDSEGEGAASESERLRLWLCVRVGDPAE